MSTPGIDDLAGYIPALPTPFAPDDTIDVAGLEALCDRLIEAGAAALLVCGVTGESPTLRKGERELVIRTAAAVAAGRAPVIAGTGSNSTARAIELSNQADRAGADASLSVVPYYSRPIQRGLICHFETIAGETSLPVLIHDAPSRTACSLADESLIRLAANPRFIGLCDAAGDPARMLRLRRSVANRFKLLSGDDTTAPSHLAQGGDGCVSTVANLLPALCSQLFAASRDGRMSEALVLAAISAPLIDVLSRESEPAPLKCALSLVGLCGAAVRLPLVEVADATRLELASILALLPEEDMIA